VVEIEFQEEEGKIMQPLNARFLGELHKSSIGKGRHKKLAQVKKMLTIVENTGGFQPKLRAKDDIFSYYTAQLQPPKKYSEDCISIKKVSPNGHLRNEVNGLAKSPIDAAIRMLANICGQTLTMYTGEFKPTKGKYEIPSYSKHLHV
jgi:hypothetical protein